MENQYQSETIRRKKSSKGVGSKDRQRSQATATDDSQPIDTRNLEDKPDQWVIFPPHSSCRSTNASNKKSDKVESEEHKKPASISERLQKTPASDKKLSREGSRRNSKMSNQQIKTKEKVLVIVTKEEALPMISESKELKMLDVPKKVKKIFFLRPSAASMETSGERRSASVGSNRDHVTKRRLSSTPNSALKKKGGSTSSRQSVSKSPPSPQVLAGRVRNRARSKSDAVRPSRNTKLRRPAKRSGSPPPRTKQPSGF